MEVSVSRETNLSSIVGSRVGPTQVAVDRALVQCSSVQR